MSNQVAYIEEFNLLRTWTIDYENIMDNLNSYAKSEPFDETGYDRWITRYWNFMDRWSFYILSGNLTKRTTEFMTNNIKAEFKSLIDHPNIMPVYENRVGREFIHLAELLETGSETQG